MSFEKVEDSSVDNAEQLFLSAYGLSDPTLFKLMKADPTQAAAIDLVVYYTEAVEDDPTRANDLASALSTLRESTTDAPTLDDESSNLAEMFSFELAKLHTRGLRISEKGTTLASIYLINCLLSGMSFKYRFAECSAQYASIMKGLDAVPDGSFVSELFVIGACIQLLTSGSYIIPTSEPHWHLKSVNEVTTKLRFQKSMGTVKIPNAVKLLNRTISHAESGFKEKNDIDDVWELLFPSWVEPEEPTWPWIRFFLSCGKTLLACFLEALSQEKPSWIGLFFALVFGAICLCWACQWPPGIHHLSEFLDPVRVT